MRKMILFLLAGGFIFFLASAPVAEAQKAKDKKKAAQKYDPPKSMQPSADELTKIEAKTAELADKIAELRKDKKTLALLPDVEIYHRGAVNIVRFKEFYSKDSVKWTLDALDRGMKRAEQLGKGKTPWTMLEQRNVLRAYRSVIDGTAQPYGVTYPLEYGKDPKRKWRVDIVLHGRGSTLTEVSFINSHSGKKKIEPDQDWVQIDIYGRGNNAYRWAGETDVMEALATFFNGETIAARSELPDYRRIVLRGFSMGGAGTWHLGLHYPSIWCVMGPGAGFTTTHDYAWKGKKDLPDYQERCLRIYDAIDYVENAQMIPIVAYSGGNDPQKLAADNIENRLRELKIGGMTHLVAPGLGHTMPKDWFKKANELWSKHKLDNGQYHPAELSFVTYSLKYRHCNWLTIDGLEKHYEKASVHGKLTGTNLSLSTKNVRGLSISFVPAASNLGFDLTVDNQKLGRYFLMSGSAIKENGKWKRSENANGWISRFPNSSGFGSYIADPKNPRKTPGLQGPIDDAFTQGFVCVIGSGATWHPSTQKFVDAKISAFKYDWAKHWRGELPTTGDYAVMPNDIRDKNLILFGDPSSNLTLAQILPKLPLKWTKDEIEFAGKKYSASEHVPVMIFPNPLNPKKYVVLNTGHTIPSEDYNKTNAMLYPRLGDYAILRMAPSAKNAAAHEVATAGLFDDFWRVEGK